MARIRSIKPEFWTSEQVAECSPNARLLFIGMWNFCDDQGIHPASVKTLKMQIFPGDGFSLSDIENMVIELMHQKLLFFYQAEGKGYWFVTGWNHQKIDKPNKKYPLPDSAKLRKFLADNSANGSRAVGDHPPEDGKGEEGSGGDDGKTASTKTELAFIRSFADKEDDLKRIFPHLNYDVEKETCLAHYRTHSEPIDPYVVIVKWFRRAKPDNPPDPSPGGSTQTVDDLRAKGLIE
jgi:hypothetical protein